MKPIHRTLLALCLCFLSLTQIAAPARATEGGRVDVVFSVDEAGQLLWVKVARPSRSSFRNEEALRAVEQAGPFPALPPGSPGHVQFRAIMAFGCTGFIVFVVRKEGARETCSGTTPLSSDLIEMMRRQEKLYR